MILTPRLCARTAICLRPAIIYLGVSGKGEKTRYLPLHPGTNELIHDYLEAAGHGADETGALFRPIRNNRTGELEKALDPDMIYKLVRSYSAELGFEIGAHSLRATAATNALDHQADITKVQEWLGHANIPRPASTIIARPDPKTVRRSI
jgi:integrase/recombinase XerD